MTLLTRITLGAIALLAVIAVVGVFAVKQVDQSHYKERIEQFVFDQTGRQLQIDGEVGVSLLPWLGLSVKDASLSNSDEFADTEFANVKSGDFEIAALPLLAGRIKVKRVVLDGLSLKLQRDADGKTNWDDLMAITAVVETKSDDNVVREVEAGAPIIAALSVGGMQITNSNISYSDGRDENYVALNELFLNINAVLLSEPFAFDSSFNLISSAASGLTSIVSAKGEVAVDLVNNIYALQQIRLSTVNSGETLPVDPLTISVNGDLIADLQSRSVNINVDDGLLSGIPVSGEFEATGLNDDLRMTGMLSSSEFDAAPVAQQLGIQIRDNFPLDLLQSAQVSARFEHSEDVLQIRQLNASLSDMKLTGDLQIANPLSSAVLSGNLQTSPFTPAPWVKGFGVDFADDTVMNMAQVSADIRQSGQLLSFNQIDIYLDNSNITGSVEISDINADSLPIAYALSVDQINMDDYLPLQSGAAGGVSPNTVWAADLIPVEALRSLSLEGELTIDELTIGGIKAANARIPLTTGNNKIEITEAKADLYAGSVFTKATLDVESAEPLLTVTGNISSVDADALLQDALGSAAGGPAPVTGIANGSVDVLSRGLAWSQLLEQASGALSLQISDGQLNGIDIASELQEAGEQILDNGIIKLAESDQVAGDSKTDFSEFSLSAVLADGVMNSDDMAFVSSELQITGEGGVNIHSHKVDYLLHLAVNQDLEQEALLKRLAGVELAIPVRGPFTDLSVDLPRVLLNAFQSGLIREVKSRYTQGDESQQQSGVDLIESKKEALRLRLEREQQQASARSRERKQQDNATTQDSEQPAERLLEKETNRLKERLKVNLKKNQEEALSEN